MCRAKPGCDTWKPQRKIYPLRMESFAWLRSPWLFIGFDRSRFLAEARRVLDSFGWLVVYDNRFLGEMKENPEHERWYREDYLVRYLSPPRNKEFLTEDECREHGFRLVERKVMPTRFRSLSKSSPSTL